MEVIFLKIAAVLFGLYAVVSVLSAVRMYRVHGRYVHVEFSPGKWRGYGKWAPRQCQRLHGILLSVLLSVSASAGVAAWKIYLL